MARRGDHLWYVHSRSFPSDPICILGADELSARLSKPLFLLKNNANFESLIGDRNIP